MTPQAIYYHDFANAYIPQIFQEIYLQKIYEPLLMGKKDLVMLDVGANIGLWSMYAAKYAKQIYAVEPAAQHQECMKLMLESNGITNVQPVQVALSNQNGTTKFYHNDNTTAFSLLPQLQTGKEGPETVMTVDFEQLFSMLNLHHVDFCKMDVEGFEYPIFSSKGFSKVCGQIDTIAGEIHPFAGINPQQIATCLKDKGFDFHFLNKTDALTFVAERKR